MKSFILQSIYLSQIVAKFVQLWFGPVDGSVSKVINSEISKLM